MYLQFYNYMNKMKEIQWEKIQKYGRIIQI